MRICYFYYHLDGHFKFLQKYLQYLTKYISNCLNFSQLNINHNIDFKFKKLTIPIIIFFNVDVL